MLEFQHLVRPHNSAITSSEFSHYEETWSAVADTWSFHCTRGVCIKSFWTEQKSSWTLNLQPGSLTIALSSALFSVLPQFLTSPDVLQNPQQYTHSCTTISTISTTLHWLYLSETLLICNLAQQRTQGSRLLTCLTPAFAAEITRFWKISTHVSAWQWHQMNFFFSSSQIVWAITQNHHEISPRWKKVNAECCEIGGYSTMRVAR